VEAYNIRGLFSNSVYAKTTEMGHLVLTEGFLWLRANMTTDVTLWMIPMAIHLLLSHPSKVTAGSDIRI